MWTNFDQLASLFFVIILASFSQYQFKKTHCFNIDTHSVLIHRGNNNSYFGYSVALHKDRGVSWLLVGSPRAQTDQKLVRDAGAVYRCSPTHNKACQQIGFDITGDNFINHRGTVIKIDEKSHQWFGATLQSAQENGSIIACSPKYIYYSNNFKRRDPIGSCWISRGSFDGFLEYSPCRVYDQWGHHKLGSCQAGFSSTISKDGSQIFMGAPGAHVWQGQVFKHNLLTDLTNSTSANNPRFEDDSYLGYSIAIGKFSARSYYQVNSVERPDVAIGVPRGADLVGKVMIVDNELQSLFNITGEQIGSYFGYSLVTADVNGDGIDDLVISAPYYYDYTNPANNDEFAYDVGRVYVAIQNFRGELIVRSKHDGFTSRGRFGSALANCGDLDHDGTDDIAIGAPYGGPNSHGAVYIFNGRRGFDGLSSKYDQVIYAASIKNDGRNLRSFGWSLSGGIDVDNNNYPDLLVGDYSSSQALLFRSRPIINATLDISIQPNYINLKDKNCMLPDSQFNVTCITVQYCLQYSGEDAENKIEFVFDIRLDANYRETLPRLSFSGSTHKHRDKTSSIISKGVQQCRSFKAHLTSKMKDLLKPIDIEIEHNLAEISLTDTINMDSNELLISKPTKLKPILNNRIDNKISKTVNILKHCGKDNVCYPDLKLSMYTDMRQYDAEKDEELRIFISVKNNGEDAFESMFFLTMPSLINYVIVEKDDFEYPLCFGTTGSNVLICDLGNLQVRDSTVNFTIVTRPAKKPYTSTEFTFLGKVNSSNRELSLKTEEDNQIIVDVPLILKSAKDSSDESDMFDSKIVMQQHLFRQIRKTINFKLILASFFVATIFFASITYFLNSRGFFKRKKIIHKPVVHTSKKTHYTTTATTCNTFWTSYNYECGDTAL